MMVLRPVRLAGVRVAVTPEHHLLQHEEGDDAARERDADAMRAGTGLDRVRQERQ
jgi:hypothetical protein